VAERRSLTIAFPALAANKQLYNLGCMVRRVSVAEHTGAAPAQFVLWDGTGTGGLMVDPIDLIAGQSTRDQYLWDEYPIENGLWCQVVTGTVDLVVVLTPSDRYRDFSEPVAVIGQLDVNVFGEG
jgi:hypothetical protein